MTADERRSAKGRAIENFRLANEEYLLLKEEARTLGANLERLGRKLQDDPLEIGVPIPNTIHKFNERVFYLDFEIPTHETIVRLVAKINAAKSNHDYYKNLVNSF